MKKRIAIFASGAGSNAKKIIDYFSTSSSIEISVVVSNKEDAGVLQIAAASHIPTIVILSKSFRETKELLETMKEMKIDFIVLAGFLLKIPLTLIEAFPNRILNIHPALLPAFGGKGMYGHHVHEAVRASQSKESGITIHFVNENYDEGAIVFQALFPISSTDTAVDIEREVRKLELLHFAPVIEQIVLSSEDNTGSNSE